METIMMRRTPAAADGPCYGRNGSCGEYFFQMPLHYPRYTKADYDAMPEWQLDRLLAAYGLPVVGDLQQKRSFAMGAFLWSPNC